MAGTERKGAGLCVIHTLSRRDLSTIYPAMCIHLFDSRKDWS